MDNVTHALAGLLLAHAAVEVRDARDDRAPSAAFARTAAIVGIAAAELPDADLVYAGAALGMGKLGYLLHHRGHTHTIVAAVVGALVVWGIALLAARRGARTPAERRTLLWLALAGTLSHIALDWTNNYGVHPFWPVNDRWYYGDAVFIVEPWLWVASIPALLVAARSVGGRLLLGFLLAVILAAAWAVGMVSRGAATALTLGAVAWLALALVSRPRRALVLAGVAWLAVEGGFLGMSRWARAVADRSAPMRPTDVVVTPSPADPLCYSTLVILNDATTYRVLSGVIAPLPRLRGVDACPSGRGTALPPTDRPSTAVARWEGEWSAPRAELAALARENCVVAAALRFVRVPAWARRSDGVAIWDLRFGGNGFASVDAPERPTACPAHVPPWTPPRADVLGMR